MAATSSGDVLTIDELSTYLKISKSTLYKLAQEDALPGQKVGRHWRFHREAVDQWLRKELTPAPKSRKRKKPR
jgi:excisionase family DNA binding protein